MQTGWLIYSARDANNNQAFISWFIKEAAKQDIVLTLLLREDLQIGIFQNQKTVQYQNKTIPLPDIAIVRTIEPLLNLHLEQFGIQVFNSSTVSFICNNKARTHFEVQKLGIPMVDTLFVKRDNLQSEPPMAYPFVVKDVNGRGGQHVYRIENSSQWEAWKIVGKGNELIFQTCHVQAGIDIRVFVVGTEIIGAVLRESKTDFRANYKLGGTATWYNLQQNERERINKIVQHFEFGMVGIDFLVDKDGGLLFNEIEDVVGSRTLSAVSNINILHQYIKLIKLKTASR